MASKIARSIKCLNHQVKGRQNASAGVEGAAAKVPGYFCEKISAKPASPPCTITKLGKKKPLDGTQIGPIGLTMATIAAAE